MPVRVVKDRPIDTFRHNIESLRENSFAIITTSSGAEIGLISKARNYSATEFDVMLSFLDDSLSAIHELTYPDREAFFSLVTDVNTHMRDISGLPLAVGLNQHPNGHTLPYINDFGQKNRVQTLQPLHVHIYETKVSPVGQRRMGDLGKKDQRDICDPLILLSGEILMNKLSELESIKDAGANIELTITKPPLGLNIIFPLRLSSFLQDNSVLIAEIQTKLITTYTELSPLFINVGDNEPLPTNQRTSNVEQYVAGSNQHLSRRSQNMLKVLAREMKDVADVPSYNTFINGLAVTYTITETEDGKTLFNIHPRLMSRGNSPDSYCIYVDNSETQSAETQYDIDKKISFYECLTRQLDADFDIQPGQFMARKSAR